MTLAETCHMSRTTGKRSREEMETSLRNATRKRGIHKVGAKDPKKKRKRLYNAKHRGIVVK